MPHDPLASLKIWPTTVTIGDQEYILPGRSAADWLPILMQDPIRVLDIVPGLLDHDDELAVLEMLAEDEISTSDLEEVALDVIAAVGGRNWWWTLRVVYLLSEHWALLFGPIALHDLTKVPLAALLDSVYYRCITNMENDKRQLFDLELETVPEGVEVELDEEAESRAFLKMMEQAQAL